MTGITSGQLLSAEERRTEKTYKAFNRKEREEQPGRTAAKLPHDVRGIKKILRALCGRSLRSLRLKAFDFYDPTGDN